MIGLILAISLAAVPSVGSNLPPDQPYIDSLISQGNIAYLNGDYEHALEFYQKAYLADENNQNAASNYALTLNELGRDLEGRWFLFDYIQKHPHAAWAWNTRAVITEKSGDYNKCLLYAQKALENDPSLSAARYNIACYLTRLDRRPEALLALRDALAEEPGLADLAIWDDDLEGLTAIPMFWALLRDQLNQ
jgi:tetratricopeptide (TPR) repeat protein